MATKKKTQKEEPFKEAPFAVPERARIKGGVLRLYDRELRTNHDLRKAADEGLITEESYLARFASGEFYIASDEEIAREEAAAKAAADKAEAFRRRALDLDRKAAGLGKKITPAAP